MVNPFAFVAQKNDFDKYHAVMLATQAKQLKALKIANTDVMQLSKQHSVALLFTKWLNNPYCQQAVLDMCNYLPAFLKMNIIPIVCYQEPADFDWFSKAATQEFHIGDVLKIANTSKAVHVGMGIKTTSFANHLSGLFTMLNYAKQNPNVLHFALPHNCANPLIQRTLMFVRNEDVQHCWHFQNCERIEYDKYGKIRKFY